MLFIVTVDNKMIALCDTAVSDLVTATEVTDPFVRSDDGLNYGVK